MAPKARILVVDDNDELRDLYAAYLGFAGYEIDEARDGAEALARIQSMPAYDVVLLDLHMRKMSGLELLRVLGREYVARVPVVVLTADQSPAISQAALDGGARNVLLKPFFPEALEGHIRTALGRR